MSVLETSFEIGPPEQMMTGIHLRSETARLLGLEPGAIVRLWSGGEPSADSSIVTQVIGLTEGGENLRVARSLVEALGADPTETLHLRREALPRCRRLALRPLGPAQDDPEDLVTLQLLAELGRAGHPVSLGVQLQAPIRGTAARQLYRIDDAEPTEAIFTEQTEVLLLDPEQGPEPAEVQAPRINDKCTDEQGQQHKFTSAILPPYMRRSPNVAEVLPVLYLRGLSTGNFQPALHSLLGEDAAGLSATNIARMTAVWEEEYRRFSKRSFKDVDYVDVWADGIHFNVRLEDDRLCTLVLIGARPDGTKEVIAVEDGYRVSAESWKSLLRRLKRLGMEAPMVAVGDGALGFWSAVRDVWPQAREQRCWCHKMVNVLDKLPKRLQAKAKRPLRDIMYAETKELAGEGIAAFKAEFSPRQERAVKCLTKDQEALLNLYDFPAEHWKHLWTTNVIESAFATVRLRQRVTKGAGKRKKALTMAFKLLEMAQQRRRRLDAAHLLPVVRAGGCFIDGVQPEREPAEEAAFIYISPNYLHPVTFPLRLSRFRENTYPLHQLGPDLRAHPRESEEARGLLGEVLCWQGNVLPQHP